MLLWVIRVGLAMSESFPGFPWKRTSLDTVGMSQSATTGLMHRSNAVSFDHLVGAGPKASLPRVLAVIGFGLRYTMM
jgi:hypothetical protein